MQGEGRKKQDRRRSTLNSQSKFLPFLNFLSLLFIIFFGFPLCRLCSHCTFSWSARFPRLPALCFVALTSTRTGGASGGRAFSSPSRPSRPVTPPRVEVDPHVARHLFLIPPYAVFRTPPHHNVQHSTFVPVARRAVPFVFCLFSLNMHVCVAH